MDSTTPLHDLIKGVTIHAESGFKALYDHLIDRVYSYVRSRVANEDDALDITQEIFIDLYKALPKFVYQSDPQGYAFVFLITKRKLAKWYALQHEGKVTQVVAFEERYHGVVDNSTEDGSTVWHMLQQLDDIAREIIVLHHWSGYTFGEIAQQLSMSEAAVRVRHHRTVKILSATLTT